MKKRRVDTEARHVEDDGDTAHQSEAIDALLKRALANDALEIGSLDSYSKDVLRSKAQELQESIERLYQAIDDANASIGRCIHGHKGVSAHDIIAYAHRISYTSFAPPGYIPGKSMLYMHKPPAPQTAQFQNSILYSLQSQKQEDEALYAPVSDTQKTEEPKGTVGMDIDPELLKKLPPMPKEWSFGDPIPGLTEKKEKKAVVEKNVSGFEFALNPDLDADIEFGAGESTSSSSDDDF